MYGKVMSIPDEAMGNYCRLVTRWPPAQVERTLADLEAGRLHPMEAKKALAWEIVERFHGGEAAGQAAERFQRVHQARELPQEMPEFALVGPLPVVELLVAAGLCGSKSQARRLVQQGGVRLDGRVVESVEELVAPGEAVLRVGKQRFLRVVPREHGGCRRAGKEEHGVPS
jgi:tyrosyl-tRNA synthetase